jgi:hypothetical protein
MKDPAKIGILQENSYRKNAYMLVMEALRSQGPVESQTLTWIVKQPPDQDSVSISQLNVDGRDDR